MKKIFAMLVAFGCIFFTTSFAATYVEYVDKTSIEDTIVKVYMHNGDGPNSSCTYPDCGGNHWNDGKFSRTPVCDCPSSDTIPSGTVVRRWTEQKDHSCNNEAGFQQQTSHHIIHYVEINDSPKCSHTTTVCSAHGKSSAVHGKGDLSNYQWDGISSNGKCSTCGRTLYIGKCSKKSTSSPKPSSTSTTKPKPSSTSTTSPKPSSTSTTKPTPTPSSGGGYSEPEPEPSCPHNNTRYEKCNQTAPSGGSKATTSDRRFSSRIDTTETYRRNNPYNVGDIFTIDGNGHVEGKVAQNGVEKYWKCNGVNKTICRDCGEVISSTSCRDAEWYTDWKTNPPTFTDTYRSVSFSFEGFNVNGKSSVSFSPSEVTTVGKGNYPWTRPTMLSSSYGSRYIITSIDATKLKEDDGKYGDKSSGMNSPAEPTSKSGLLYGYAYVRCSCGCTQDRYRIYFDLTPPSISDEEGYTLTLRADGAPTTGGVKIYEDNDYKDYTQKTSPIGDSFSISAKANDGYEFDAWYKLDGNKYSEEKDRSIIMPGYNLTLIAKFKPLERYNVTVYSDGNGDVKFDGKYDDGQEGWEIYANVVKGDDIEIIARPNENYVVDYWELVREENRNLGNENSLTISEVEENYIIFVHFKPAIDGEYNRLSTTPNGPGYTIGGTDYAIVGQDYPIWAFPIGDAEFKYWKEDSTITITDFGSCDIVKMPNKDYDLTAYFVDSDDTYHQVIVKGDGNGDISINGEEPRPKDTATVEDGTKITINAYPDEGFEFDKWTDEDGNVIPGGPELTVTIDEDKIYIAHFEYVGEGYKLKVESAGGGKVRGNVDDAIAGNEYPIKAIPNENCEFLYWANKETGEITDYADYDYVMMPDEDVTLVAHFRELGEDEKDKYYLTLKTQGSGTVSGEGWYKPDEDIIIVATPRDGYEFVGWYEDNLLVSTVEKYPPIKMPYYNMTLTAVFKLAGDNSENSPFKILSIRDVRWKDYFTGNGATTNNELYVPSDATNNTVLVNSAKLIDNSYNSVRDIVYGYAVEFELVTTGISKNQSGLTITPTIYERTSSGRLNKVNIDLGKYKSIMSASSENVKDFMITSEEKMISMPNSQTAPQVTWRWVWYLPLDIYDEICDKVGKNSDIVVNFEIYVNAVGSSAQRFDYVKTINYLNRSNWGGNVFTYRLDKTLLEDIYNNANN